MLQIFKPDAFGENVYCFIGVCDRRECNLLYLYKVVKVISILNEMKEFYIGIFLELELDLVFR